jgi:hypothetical protein
LSEQPVPPLVPIATVRSVTVYANSFAAPMATLWTRARSVPVPEEATTFAMTDWALPVAGTLDVRYSSASEVITSAESLSVDAKSARVVVDAPADGILLLTQQDAPGWRVFVDGAERRKLLGFGIFRSVEVPRGRHEVVWRYRPLSMYVGGVMTIIAALALQLGKFVKRPRQKNFL